MLSKISVQAFFGECFITNIGDSPVEVIFEDWGDESRILGVGECISTACPDVKVPKH
jgi:hypothetical protein